MDKFPMMVYKAPGSHEVHGHLLSIATATSEEDLAEAKSAGWFETTTEAAEAYAEQQREAHERRVAEANALAQAQANASSKDPAPTRAEMEVKAKELGIEVKANTTDAALLKAINAKLAGRQG